MTTTYRATGSLQVPVSNLQAARAYLDEPMEDYLDEDLAQAVHTIRWDLTDASTWVVTLVANRKLTVAERTGLSSWISGQNSDGLGEGFEQQSWAEHGMDNEDWEHDEDFEMSSFDWQTNPCTLVVVK